VLLSIVPECVHLIQVEIIPTQGNISKYWRILTRELNHSVQADLLCVSDCIFQPTIRASSFNYYRIAQARVIGKWMRGDGSQGMY
jgi:hypothetical protein